MKLHQLQAFVVVAELNSINAAAARLSLSQPAVTNIVRDLERELDVPLVVRGIRGVTLTEFGRALQLRALRLLKDAQSISDEIEQLKGNLTGEVRVGTISTASLLLIPEALTRFQARMPDVQMFFNKAGFPGYATELREGKLDLVLTTSLPEERQSEFEVIPLVSLRQAIACRHDHPLAKATSLTELSDARWILPYRLGEKGDKLSPLFERHGVPAPSQAIHCTSFTIANALMRDADILSFPNQLLLQHPTISRDFTAIPVREELPCVDMALVMCKEANLTPAVTYFIECLREVAAGLEAHQRF